MKIRFKNILRDPANRLLVLILFFITFIGFLLYIVEFGKNPEIQSLFDAFWWLIVTIATVGYGDIVPKTFLGKIIGIIIIMSGVTLFSLISGSIASLLVEWRIKERKGLGKVKFKNHLVILGWNNHLEKTLEAMGKFIKIDDYYIVLVNQAEEEDYENFKSKFPNLNIKFIHGDFTKENVLKRANISYAAYIIILSDTYGGRSLEECDERTLISILLIRTLNNNAKIFAEVIKEEKAKYILRAGADDVILGNEFNSILLSSALLSPAYHMLLREIASLDKMRVKLIPLPKNFIGKTFIELFNYFKRTSSSIVIGLVSMRKEFTIDDFLSSDSAIDNFIRQKFEEAEEDFFEEEKKDDYDLNLNPKDDYVISENDKYIFIIE
ncbi:voltage-gated potassium channel [Marinitoga hydrogenitolerans DSM 16785]|uniref:Voltage-gated potassium channel n=1 Tax=Marinitoga hydrogenitolerans (strain DSM 16785 / JCM 12826 / AT1271) TaxID=1122195 RepID=A0A1M4Z8J4_MARH1|nr:potassium channel family protein [Marinitoga hydrogenitolerans]SHF14340.1 voltage-gated potassium channel [Marinitoga hydrogenitolerans DSM 16785]